MVSDKELKAIAEEVAKSLDPVTYEKFEESLSGRLGAEYAITVLTLPRNHFGVADVTVETDGQTITATFNCNPVYS